MVVTVCGVGRRLRVSQANGEDKRCRSQEPTRQGLEKSVDQDRAPHVWTITVLIATKRPVPRMWLRVDDLVPTYISPFFD